MLMVKDSIVFYDFKTNLMTEGFANIFVSDNMA